MKTGTLTIKSTDMEIVYDLRTRMIYALSTENVLAVTKLGRSFTRSRDYDAMGADAEFVRCPEGETQQRRKAVHTVSSHEIDVIDSGTEGFLVPFAGDTGESQRYGIRSTLKVAEWHKEARPTSFRVLSKLDRRSRSLVPQALDIVSDDLKGELTRVNRSLVEIEKSRAEQQKARVKRQGLANGAEAQAMDVNDGEPEPVKRTKE